MISTSHKTCSRCQSLRVVVLASGQGIRFAPLTNFLPKPLLPAANRPLLEHLLHSLEGTGVTDVLITVGHLASVLEKFIPQFSTDLPITIVPAPHWRRGPLASFTSVIPHLKDDKEPFLLLPCDIFLSTRNIKLLCETSSDFALLYDSQTFHPGSNIILDVKGQVTQLARSSIPITKGFSSLPALRATSALFDMMKWSNRDVTTTVFELLQLWIAKGRQISGIPIIPDVWFDVDTPQTLLDLNNYLLTTGWPPTLTPTGTYLSPNKQLTGPIKTSEVFIGQQTRLEGPVLIGSGVRIGEGCFISDGTTLGASTLIRNNTALQRCLTLPQTEVPTCADLQNVILDTEGNAIR